MKLEIRSRGSAFLFLFACVPLAIVAVMAWIVVGSVRTAAEMKTWTPVPATIESVDLVEHRGDDSTTYSVRATYRYVFEGSEYTGARVGVHGGSDNIGRWHQDRFAELDAARRAGRSVTCFVDPRNPANAVLFPTPRTGLLAFYLVFVVIFGLAGVLLFAMAARGVARNRRSAERALLHPNDPWRWRDEWATGSIPATASEIARIAIPFAVIWNVISYAVLAFAWGESDGPTWLLLLFPAIGALLAAWAVRAAIRSRRYGRAQFHLATQPGRVGGRLAGVVQIPLMESTEGPYVFTLRCARRSRSGKSTVVTTVWEASSELAADRVAANIDGVALPVSFDIPAGLPPTTIPSTLPCHEWTLNATARQEGIDLDVTFPVPVLEMPGKAP